MTFTIEHDPDWDLCATCSHERFFHDPRWSIYESCGAQVDNGGCSDPEHCVQMTCLCDTFKEPPHD
jgi:hypothetical protein